MDTDTMNDATCTCGTGEECKVHASAMTTETPMDMSAGDGVEMGEGMATPEEAPSAEETSNEESATPDAETPIM